VIHEPKTSLISLCTWAHRDVWKVSSVLIPKFINATDYKVYVPQKEYKKFSKATGKGIMVLPETELDLSFSDSLKVAVQLAGNEQRYNWYFQQFVKIQAILEDPNENIIIWDSDCVPVRKVRFFEDTGEPIMYSSSEFNQDYFPPIKRLLNLDKLRVESFIAPGFPITKNILQTIISEIEKRHSTHWTKALIANIDFSKPSGFSEYETLGTWVVANVPETVLSSDMKWERYGQSRFGYPQSLGVDKILTLGEKSKVEVISFEAWDLRGFKKFLADQKVKVDKFIESQ
jgi:hypothetical protein